MTPRQEQMRAAQQEQDVEVSAYLQDPLIFLGGTMGPADGATRAGSAGEGRRGISGRGRTSRGC